MQQKEVKSYLANHPELSMFVRHHPMWYRYLSREPERVHELPRKAKTFYGKTFSQRLAKINNQIQLAEIIMEFTRTLKK